MESSIVHNVEHLNLFWVVQFAQHKQPQYWGEPDFGNKKKKMLPIYSTKITLIFCLNITFITSLHKYVIFLQK